MVCVLGLAWLRIVWGISDGFLLLYNGLLGKVMSAALGSTEQLVFFHEICSSSSLYGVRRLTLEHRDTAPFSGVSQLPPTVLVKQIALCVSSLTKHFKLFKQVRQNVANQSLFISISAAVRLLDHMHLSFYYRIIISLLTASVEFTVTPLQFYSILVHL